MSASKIALGARVLMSLPIDGTVSARTVHRSLGAAGYALTKRSVERHLRALPDDLAIVDRARKPWRWSRRLP